MSSDCIEKKIENLKKANANLRALESDFCLIVEDMPLHVRESRRTVLKYKIFVLLAEIYEEGWGENYKGLK